MKNRQSTTLWRLLVVIVVLATIWVWQKITVVKMVQANDRLRDRVEMKREKVDKISADISRLQHQARIEKIAVECLGLAPTRPGQRRYLPIIRTTPDRESPNGWQRFNNSIKRLSMVSAAGDK
jgi:cell division protein FtsL